MTRHGDIVECEGQLYKVTKARGDATCSCCYCAPCRLNGKPYAASCYKLIGPNCYLRKYKPCQTSNT